MRRVQLAACLIVCFPVAADAQPSCQGLQARIFAPQQISVVLAKRIGGGDDSKFIVFRSRLRVNTDGAPNSYHPRDPRGESLAINNVVNGVGLRRSAGRALTFGEKIALFERWRDAGWRVPVGFRITWENVIAARTVTEGGQQRSIPCVFGEGPHAGYLGSLTTLKNGLTGPAAGECGVNDQLDQRVVPALVMAGGNNPLRAFGARIGDLVLAANPNNGRVQAAVIGDAGPPDNLGEGSVALNMALLGRTDQPKNYRPEALSLDTGSQKILVAIVPQSRDFQLDRPYGADNIKRRVEAWASEKGYGSIDGLLAAVRSCAQ
jgi:hypothetical protein